MKQKQLKRKTIIVTLVFLAVGGILFKSIFTTSMQIYEKKKEKKEYTTKLEKLKDKEDDWIIDDVIAKFPKEWNIKLQHDEEMVWI